MPDIADQAKALEMLQRECSIKQARNIKEPAQQVVKGRVLCIDCDAPVQMARLAAKANAARCIHCQQENENKGKRLYGIR